MIDTDLKDLADGFEETGRGVPHNVAGGRECNGREGSDPVVGGQTRFGTIGDMGTGAEVVGYGKGQEDGEEWVVGPQGGGRGSG